MYKTLLLLLVSLGTALGVSAQRLPNPYADHSPQQPFAAAAAAHHSPKKAYVCNVKPEGTAVPYIMSGFYDTVYGMMQIVGFSNTVYLAEDGTTAYVGSLLPRDIKTDEMWHKGTISGDKLAIDCSEVAVTLVEDYGTYKFHFGEYYEEDRSWKIKDLELNIERADDGSIARLYVDDDVNFPQRHIGLCLVDSEGGVVPYVECRCLDLELYDKSMEFTELPATAEVSDYIYYGSSSFATDFAQKGRVAIAPSTERPGETDYYFDGLLPEMGNAWVKGRRSGQTITLDNDQYLGNDLGYYLYYNGTERLRYNELYGNWDVAISDICLTIADDGVISVENPGRCMPGAYTAAGYLYYYTKEMRIEPCGGDDVPLTPSMPSEVVLYDQFNDFGVFCLVFNLTNMTADGKYLDPDGLSYCIYLDDELYTFRRSQYPNIEQDMTYVPFGYSDKRADEYSDIVNRDIVWNVVNLREDMFERVGVQAVFNGGGETRHSSIVYVDLDGRTSVVNPDGIAPTLAQPVVNAPAYDLSGRRTAAGQSGISIQGGRTVIR